MKKNIKGARIFMTGANGSIGKEVVKLLIKEEAASIVLACRTEEKAQSVISDMPNSSTKLEPFGGFDMADENAIGQAVNQLGDAAFDIVFLQSGGMVVANDYQFIESKDQKIEKTIFQNVMGPYLTMKLLFEKHLISKNTSIIFPGGEGARGIKGLIKKPVFNFPEDLMFYIENGSVNYSDIDALGVSKFMSALLVQKLALLDNDRTYLWFSPGLTSGTKGLSNVPNPKRFIMEKIGFPLMTRLGLAQKPEQAAQKYVDCLKGKYGESGSLIGAPEGKALGKLVDQKPMNPALTNYQLISTFWTKVVEVCGDLTLVPSANVQSF